MQNGLTSGWLQMSTFSLQNLKISKSKIQNPKIPKSKIPTHGVLGFWPASWDCGRDLGAQQAGKLAQVISPPPRIQNLKISKSQDLKISKLQNLNLKTSSSQKLAAGKRVGCRATCVAQHFCPMADQPDVQPNLSRKQRKLLLPPEVPRPMDKGERWNPRGGRRRRRSWQEPLPPSPAASSLLPPSGGQVAQCSSTSLHQVAPMDPRLSIPTSAAGCDLRRRRSCSQQQQLGFLGF